MKLFHDNNLNLDILSGFYKHLTFKSGFEMKYFFLIYLCVFSHLQSHELSICCIFKNDAKYIPEWIEFHKKQGVDHFYLYNNDSKDCPESILKPYIEENIVTLIPWNFSHIAQSDWNQIQVNAYMDCIERIRYSDTWCAFLDTDEFLFCPNNYLNDILRDYLSFASIKVYWRCYGTSSVEKINDGEKIVNYLTHRARDDHHWNTFVKLIVQPKYVTGCPHPHEFYVQFPAFDTQNSVDIFRINHYWSRDRDFFMHEKVSRRINWGSGVQDLINLEIGMNEIYDPILKDKM